MHWATFLYRYVIESADQLMLAGVRVLWFLFSLWQIAGCLSSYTSGWGHRAARRVWTRRRHYTCTADTPERVCLWVYTLCVLNVPTFFWLQVIRAILQRSQQKMWIFPVVCWRFWSSMGSWEFTTATADENQSDISLAEMSTDEVMFSHVRWASILTFWRIICCFKDTRPNKTHRKLLWKTKRRSCRF